MISNAVAEVVQGVTEDNDQIWRHEEGPIVPDATPAIQVTKDDVLNNITLQVPNNQHERQEQHPAQVTIMFQLADRDSASELYAIAVHIEDHDASPGVWIPTGLLCANCHLHNNRKCPDGANTEQKNLRSVNFAIDEVHDEFFGHAADRVEDEVACE